MAVNSDYKEFVLEALERVAPVTSRAMFGGVGIYADGLIFALIADDSVYFKVDDSNRPDFERAGRGPFLPFGDVSKPMQYYELPPELLESPEEVRPWMEKAIAVAWSARRRKRK
jgi:DNA transformation protein